VESATEIHAAESDQPSTGTHMTLNFAPERIEMWPLSKLQPYAKNAKVHGADQVAKIAASMAEFGWTVPGRVGEDGGLIAGHGRVLAATQLGLTEAPVIVLGHLTEAQRRAYRIADNKLTELSEWNEAALSAELQDLLAEDYDLSLVGFSDGELDKLLAFHPDGGGEEEGGAGGSVPPVTIPEPPRNPASRTGDLWLLGDHRLLCGDATNHEDVRRLMNGERAVLFATDPPYLVDYDGSNHPTRNKDWSASYGTTWDDSSQGAELYDGFIGAAVAEAITEDAAWYCWHASRRQAMLEECWKSAGKGRGLRAPADHLGEGPRRPDPLALPVEARALLHGLAPSAPPAEGGRGNAALDLGNAVLRQGRAPGSPDAEAARRLRHPDAPARRAGRALLRAVLGLRLANHGGGGQRSARLRDGDQPGLSRQSLSHQRNAGSSIDTCNAEGVVDVWSADNFIY
jgi:ParB-like chromosome segregation protein Spo0J